MNVRSTLNTTFRRQLLAALLWLTLPVSLAYAQEFRATVTGRVTDPNGAAVPAATVIITNVNTNVSVTTIEAFNALNTPIYGGPETGINSTRFGRITLNQINFPRHIQLGLRFAF
jgi:hypothetical protein